MGARLHKLAHDLRTTFWLVPAVLVTLGVLAAFWAVSAEGADWIPDPLMSLLYEGGESGARTLLGAIATSTIGVTGTLFSITIAALTLASSQMGPRLLDNFTRDRGNQVVLGVFLGTFAYCLVVLRQVRGGEDDLFVPRLALAGAMLLGGVCVALLVYYVHHMSSRINIDTVIDLVRRDFFAALDAQTEPAPTESRLGPGAIDLDWDNACPVLDTRNGYLQQLETEDLAQWALAKGARIRLLVRPGDFIMAGGCVAQVWPPEVEGAQDAVIGATALSARRTSGADLEYSARQLVEVAVRALSPGINDPMTAIAVLDQLGSALCRVANRTFVSGVTVRDGRVILVRPVSDYAGLVDVSFDMIRQSGAGAPSVLIRMLEILALVAEQERDADRLAVLVTHADKIMSDGSKAFANDKDLQDLHQRHRALGRVVAHGGPARRTGP
ncbi:DUF2254 domain-containing protein [Phenylobacterium sp.]|uniref:DUF2254 domain-containing protein n=1 Tax=Phenylobacterium sp. TaxID=1871053 RepID=UPI00272F41B7|nr:DUF2254 domain-containing protein [Phenylobacterium sp.]MDP1875266.1 DUF2254 domain-containing protein [Phenylobacterium sp.]